MTEKSKELLKHLISELYRKAAQQKKDRPPYPHYLLSQNGIFLGNLNNNPYDPNSIFNKYSKYGSIYSPLSIFNKYGPYGSIYSSESPFSVYASAPPKIYLNNIYKGILTKNKYLVGAIEPEEFLEWVRSGFSHGSFETFRYRYGNDYLIAGDGTFLGKLTNNIFEPDSIFNDFGKYGNPYSSTSIFNEYGPYGSVYSNLSPFNEYANNPPKIYINRVYDGRLTKNRYISDGKDPDEFLKKVKEGSIF